MSNSCSNDYRFGFNGQEKDQEIYNNQSTTTATFWEYDGRIGRRWNRDPKPSAGISDYACFGNNPIMNVDVKGDSVWLFATRLPGLTPLLGFATHTFILVKANDKKPQIFAYGAKKYNEIFGTSPLVKKDYDQDKRVAENGESDNAYKNSFFIEPPKGKTIDQFDQDVINTANSFGNNPEIKYDIFTNSETTGNCNSASYTILNKAGISTETLNKKEKEIPGINTGFGKKTAWNWKEQDNAVKGKKAKKTSQWENNTGGSK